MNEKSILYSTTYDARFSNNALLTTYELEYETGEVERMIDIADWKWTSLIRRIKNFKTIRYNGVKKFTTIAYEQYGTATAYRLILAFNGFIHPYEVAQGTMIRIPDPVEVTELLEMMNSVKNDLLGKQIVI